MGEDLNKLTKNVNTTRITTSINTPQSSNSNSSTRTQTATSTPMTCVQDDDLNDLHIDQSNLNINKNNGSNRFKNTTNSNNQNPFSLNEEQLLQYKIQQCQLELYKQASMKSTKHVKINDFLLKINRLYSKILVNYHWVFLLVGVVISCLFTGLSFMKQPLPNFLDPKRGFGARGEGTLTSQLIVMKNINTEITKYNKYILDVYERIKKENRSAFQNEDEPQIGDEDDGPYPGVDDANQPDDNQNDDQQDDEAYQENYDLDDKEDKEKTDKKAQNQTLIGVKSDSIKQKDDKKDFNEDDKDDDYLDNEKLRRFRRYLDHNNHINNQNLGHFDEQRYNELMKSVIWKKLKGNDILNMINPDLQISHFPNLKSLDHCNFSLGLDENLEYYFESSSNEPKLTETSQILDKEFLESLDSFTKYLDLKIDLSLANMHIDSTNLLNVENLKSLCKWDRTMLEMLGHSESKPLCYLSLPQIIANLNNKTSCLDLNEQDVKNFLKITLMCYPLQKTGILYAFSDEYKQKPEIINLLNKNNPIKDFINLPEIKDNICVHKNIYYFIYEHLIDKNFLTSTNNYFNVKVSALIISNYMKQFNENFLFQFYMNKFHTNNYEDQETKLSGLNLAGVRQEAAMKIISSEISLVALAITLIVIVTLLYLRSIFISMIVNLGVALSVGVAFFAYRIVFDIDLFPFINMMAAFLLIGIACDDVYVLFDAWYTEKARIIMEDLPELIEKQYATSNDTSSPQDQNSDDHSQLLPPIFIKDRFLTTAEKTEVEMFLDSTTNPLKNSSIYNELVEKGININEYKLNPCYVRLAPLTDEQMIRVMGGTLHHAASSIFVTSFTTSAAFLTNLITKIPYVQLFGFFTGSCILVYFCMVITMVAAFVVTYEKYIQPFRCKVTTKLTRKLENWFERSMETLALINHRLIAENLPYLLIKFRVFWFLLFLAFGISGMLVVFYKPRLKPPPTWRYQFFKDGNKFENFEFKIKDEISSYVNEEKRNLTNPEIFFIFGIIDKDTGRVFNPDDDGHLVYDKSFDFLEKSSQMWLNQFINVSIAQRRDLFLADDIVEEWNRYLFQMQQFCYDTMNISEELIYTKIFLPYERTGLSKCRDEINSFLVNSTVDNFEQLMSSFPRRIIFMSNGSDVNAIILRVNANRTFTSHETVQEYYLEVKHFHEEVFMHAPPGFNTGWFISVAFALYDLQHQIITGTYSSLITSMLIALITLLVTSGNVLVSIYAIITISFSIADTIAIFVLLGWNLSILESIVIIMSVGLSVDFSCHYGVAYINSDREFNYDNSLCCNSTPSFEDNDSLKKTNNTAKKKCKCLRNIARSYKHNNRERFIRISDIFNRVGSAVLMAAFTTFLAGSSMYPSGLTSFGRMGQFLMLVMCISYLYATFFFVPMCALFGPTKNFGNLKFKEWTLFFVNLCCKKKKERNTETNNDMSEASGVSDPLRLNDKHLNGDLKVVFSSDQKRNKNTSNL